MDECHRSVQFLPPSRQRALRSGAGSRWLTQCRTLEEAVPCQTSTDPGRRSLWPPKTASSSCAPCPSADPVPMLARRCVPGSEKHTHTSGTMRPQRMTWDSPPDGEDLVVRRSYMALKFLATNLARKWLGKGDELHDGTLGLCKNCLLRRRQTALSFE